MELSSQEGEMPIPINSTYGGGGGHGHGHGHMIHHEPAVVPHNHIIIPTSAQILPSNGPIIPSSPLNQEEHVGGPGPHYKKMVRYRECLKNHAASMGGNATDGCGEFMPSGEEGTLEALTCSACNCHRNFHRKETEGDHQQPPSPCDCYHGGPHLNRAGLGGRKLILGHHNHHHHKAILGPESFVYPARAVAAAAAGPAHHQMIMSYNMGSVPSESDEQEDGGLNGLVSSRPTSQLVKKRFRTKFSQEQKEKMLNFAEKVGWKIQKQEESVVQQFCQEVGVKRRVLKVWMHNNKHNLAKKNHSSTTNPQTQI